MHVRRRGRTRTDREGRREGQGGAGPMEEEGRRLGWRDGDG